jgi:hypothetical protein
VRVLGYRRRWLLGRGKCRRDITKERNVEIVWRISLKRVEDNVVAWWNSLKVGWRYYSA